LRYTNYYKLPETIVRAVKRRNAAYDRGPAHRSVTQIIMPPRIDLLRKRHFHEMEKDVSEEWFALFGTAVHQILEWGVEKNEIAEERLYEEVDGWVLSGMMDCQTIRVDDHIEIVDYKVTAAYNLQGDKPKPEWEQQMNLQAYLVEKNKGVPVRRLTIMAIVRDWFRSKAQSDPTYPIAPVVAVTIPLWTAQRREDFAKECVRIHRLAEMHAELGMPLPECTASDRWERGHKYVVMKEGRKRAVRVCSSEQEAADILTAKGDGHYIEERPGKSMRCAENYCGVAPFCEQWAEIRKNRTGEDDG